MQAHSNAQHGTPYPHPAQHGESTETETAQHSTNFRQRITAQHSVSQPSYSKTQHGAKQHTCKQGQLQAHGTGQPE